MDWDSKMPPWNFAEFKLGDNCLADLKLGVAFMGWDLNMPPWDFAEFKRGDNYSADLKLGGLGDFRPSDKWNNQQSVVSTVAMVSSSSGSLKRARAPTKGSQIASCLVDGCVSDLSKCRDYHRRHKVCEIHSRTAIVMVRGQEQRFCQQCSRFHLLVEFDEVKRSCRKRLDGHNRRRRKPPPGSLNSGSFIIDHQGTRFTSYSQIIPTATPMSNWAALIKTEEDPLLYTHRLPLHLIDGHRQHFPVSSLGSYKAGKQFPFLQGNVEASSTSQPLPKTVSVTTASSSSSKPFDSDGALSLLSSPAAHTSGINLSQVAAADDRIPMDQPLVPGLQYGGLGRYSHSQASSSVSPAGFSCSVMEDEHGGTVLVSDGSGADFHCHDLLHVGSEGASDGNYQTLPFSWQQ